MINIKINTIADGITTQEVDKPFVRYFEVLKKQVDSKLGSLSYIITQGIKDNIDSGKDIYDKAFAKLKPSTISNKKGSILNETGQLRNSIQYKKVSDGYEIFVGGNRSMIAYYLQVGRANMTSREFFGISPATEKRIDSFLANIINEEK